MHPKTTEGHPRGGIFHQILLCNNSLLCLQDNFFVPLYILYHIGPISNMTRASTLRQQRQVEKALNPPEQGGNFSAKTSYIFSLSRKLISANWMHFTQDLPY